jgi:hypothetical protein
MASDSKHGGVARQPATRPRRSKRGGLFSLDAESSSRLLLIGVVGLVVVVALGFIAYGYYDSVIKPRNRTVLSVDGTTVSFSEMKRRMRYEYSLSAQTYQQAPQILSDVTYEALVEELLLTQRAVSALGLTLDEAESERRLRVRVGAVTDADQRTFADALRNELSRTGLQEDELRRLVRAEYIRSLTRDKLNAEIPATLEQAKLEVISVDGQEAAQQVVARIQSGEDWGTVAREVSTQPDVDSTGGVVNHRPRELHNAAYRDFAFSGAPGEVSPPLAAATTSPDGTTTYFVVRVVDRSAQPLAQDLTSAFVSNQYTTWLDDQKSQVIIEDKFDEVTRTEALIDVINDPLPAAEPPQAPPVIPPAQQPPPVQAPPSDPAAPPVPVAPVAPAPGDGQ